MFDQFVNAGVVKDSFSMQLCGSSEIDLSSEPTVAGTMVSFKWNLKQFCSRCNFSPLWISFWLRMSFQFVSCVTGFWGS